MPSVLVTGSAGGIGSAVVAHMDAAGWRVGELDPPAGFYGDDNIFWHNMVVCQGVNDPDRSQEMWLSNYSSVLMQAQLWLDHHQHCEEQLRHTFIVVTSNSADIPRTNSLDYCATKAAADMAVRVLHREYAALGREFYSLAPGQVQTPMFDRAVERFGEESMRAAVERSPLKRPMRPTELAEIIHAVLTTPAFVWAAGNTWRLDSGEH